VPEWLYVTLRFLHPGGWLVAFLAVPVALLSEKGARRHILAGRVAAVGMATGATAGILLALIRDDGPVVELALMGFLAAFFITSGYLTPRIVHGSPTGYRWDRGLTVVGILASIGLIAFDLPRVKLEAPLQDGVVVGALGLWIAIGHWRWRGAKDPVRWRVEHLSSFLGAYLILWWFVFWLYLRMLPRPLQTLIPGTIGVAGLLWARRRFGAQALPEPPGVARGASPRGEVVVMPRGS
jgi:hypothetical protein